MKNKVIQFKDVKPSGRTYDKEKIMLLFKIWQTIHYSNLRKEPIKKNDLIFKFGKHKVVVERIWECVYDLKIEWPLEMYDRVFE